MLTVELTFSLKDGTYLEKDDLVVVFRKAPVAPGRYTHRQQLKIFLLPQAF